MIELSDKVGTDGVFSEASGLDISFTDPLYFRKDYHARHWVLKGLSYLFNTNTRTYIENAISDFRKVQELMERLAFLSTYATCKSGTNIGMEAARHPYSLTREEHWTFLEIPEDLKVFAYLHLDCFGTYAKDATSRKSDHGSLIIQMEKQLPMSGEFFRDIASTLRYADTLASGDKSKNALFFSSRGKHGEQLDVDAPWNTLHATRYNLSKIHPFSKLVE